MTNDQIHAAAITAAGWDNLTGSRRLTPEQLAAIRDFYLPHVVALLAAPDAESASHFGDFISTFTGLKFYPFEPRGEQIEIRDIAHGLSNVCRYGGHCINFYSVAEHSTHLADWCRDNGLSAAIQLCALLHDAPEAYLADIVRPVKLGLPEYRALENTVMAAVSRQFKLGAMPAIVNTIDNRILIDERAQNMRDRDTLWTYGGETEALGVDLEYLPPPEAEKRFLDRFYTIMNQLT